LVSGRVSRFQGIIISLEKLPLKERGKAFGYFQRGEFLNREFFLKHLGRGFQRGWAKFGVQTFWKGFGWAFLKGP